MLHPIRHTLVRSLCDSILQWWITVQANRVLTKENVLVTSQDFDVVVPLV